MDCATKQDGFYIHSEDEKIALHEHVPVMGVTSPQAYYAPIFGTPLYIDEETPPGILRLIQNGRRVKDYHVR